MNGFDGLFQHLKLLQHQLHTKTGFLYWRDTCYYINYVGSSHNLMGEKLSIRRQEKKKED